MSIVDLNFVSIPSPVETLMSGTAGVWDALKNERFNGQLESRRRLRLQLDEVSGAGGSSINWSRIELYKSLNELLNTGENDRFILYYPFDLIPSFELYRHRKYHELLDIFVELYMQSWHRLLHIHDVRANFIDGDVPDAELDDRPMEMVVQAAYLAPILLQKGLLSNAKIYSLYGHDEVLNKSLKEAFVPPAQITPNYSCDGVSEKRAKWLRSEKQRQYIKNMGKAFIPFIEDIFQEQYQLNPNTHIHIAALNAAIESAFINGQISVIHEIYDRYGGIMIRLVRESEYQDEATSLLCRLYSTGIITKDVLEDVSIVIPSLNGPFYQNLAIVEDLLINSRQAFRNQELIDVIYPVMIIYGSRLKGYGGINADVDMAVFVRPEITDQVLVDNILNAYFGPGVTQYWLVDDGDNLKIKDFVKVKACVGNSTDSHVIFGGAWEGDYNTIEMLCHKLLKPYTVADEEIRRVLLEEMERDYLQYRLLHRGYERFNIVSGPTFFDNGYRRMASQIYTSQVIIP